MLCHHGMTECFEGSIEQDNAGYVSFFPRRGCCSLIHPYLMNCPTELLENFSSDVMRVRV